MLDYKIIEVEDSVEEVIQSFDNNQVLTKIENLFFFKYTNTNISLHQIEFYTIAIGLNQ